MLKGISDLSSQGFALTLLKPDPVPNENADLDATVMKKGKLFIKSDKNQQLFRNALVRTQVSFRTYYLQRKRQNIKNRRKKNKCEILTLSVMEKLGFGPAVS